MLLLVSKFVKDIIDDCIERKKPVRLLDLLKHANATRNKQAHRMTSDSKRGRQFLSDKNKFITGQGKPIGNKPEEPKFESVPPDGFKPEGRADSKTDI